MRWLRFLWVFVFSLGLALVMDACVREAPDTRAADERAIRELDAACLQAAQAKDVDSLLSVCYADDAFLFPPNAPLARGKASIRAAWSQFMENPGYSLNWQMTKVEVSRGGDLAHASGTYESTLNDPTGTPVADGGKWVVVYKRQPDGSWKVVSDIWNSDQSPPPS